MARTARAVDEALADAARLRGEAQAAPPGETARWAEALSAAKRAEGLLARARPTRRSGAGWPRLLARLERERAAAAEKARRLEADRVLLADLESVRGNRAEHRRRASEADADYAAAFRKAGLDLDKTEPGRGGPVARGAVRAGGAGRLPRRLGLRPRSRRGGPRPTGGGWSRRRGRPTPTRGATPSGPGSRPPTRPPRPSSAAWPTTTRPSTPSRRRAWSCWPASSRTAPDDRERAARVLRRAALRHPADFWTHFELSLVHGDRSGYGPAITGIPRSPAAHLRRPSRSGPGVGSPVRASAGARRPGKDGRGPCRRSRAWCGSMAKAGDRFRSGISRR